MAKKKRNWVGVFIMLILLAIFPAFSYFYMQKGLDYQLTARGELQDLGAVMALPDTTFFGDTLIGVKMGKQVQLIAYFDPSEEESAAFSAKYFGEIHEQFDDVSWFRIDLLAPQNQKAALERYQETHKMKDREQVFWYATTAQRQEINAALYVKSEYQLKPNCAVLADTNGVVVNYYDLADGKQFVRLIEHIAILRPQEKAKPKAIFQRERNL